jgi:acetylornithine deacetylase/succinyl-diaminopimelate desuccinylase-like protein
VPAEHVWAASPYAGIEREGELLGVGASDCKGGLAAQIYAGALLNASALPVGGNIVVAATVAEENGCSVGVRHLIEDSLPRIGLSATCAILGEPTALNVCCGHDGWVEVDVTVKDEGGNAAALASRLSTEFRRSLPETVASNHRVLMRTSEPAVAADDSGRAYVVRVTRRLGQGQLLSGLLEWVRRRATEVLGETRATVEVSVHEEDQRLFTGRAARVRFQSHPWATDRFDPMVESAREALVEAGWRRVALKDWALRELGMGTAGAMLVREYHIPTFGFGPGDERLAHQPNETVKVKRLIEAAYGTAVLAHRIVGTPAFEWPRPSHAAH